jgi:hypothetical protein
VGAVIKIENQRAMVVVHLVPEIKQVLYNKRRDTPLLQSGLGVIRKRAWCGFLS